LSVNYADPNYRPLVDFSWLSDGWTLFKRQSSTWILAMLIAGIIFITIAGALDYFSGALSSSKSNPQVNDLKDFALLFLPHSAIELVSGLIQYVVLTVFSAGLYRMAIRQIRGEAISPGDIFAIGDIAGPVALLAAMMWGINTLGTYLCCIPGLIAQGLLMFATLYVAIEGAKPTDALARSFNTLKDQWLMATLFYFVGSIVATLGACACGVGLLATVPMFVLSVAIGYSRFSGMGGGGPMIDYWAPQPGAWPPPPSIGQQQPPSFGSAPQSPYGQPGYMPGQQAAPGEQPPVQRGPVQPPQGWHGRADDTWVDVQPPNYNDPGSGPGTGDRGQQ